MKKIRGAAVALSMAALLAGCGGDDDGGSDGESAESSSFADQPADEIVATASEAMTELTSVHVAGETVSDGETMSVDIRVSSSGACTGTFGGSSVGMIEVLGVDDQVWFQGDDAFMAGFPSGIQQQIDGKWIADTDGSFAEFCDLEQLMDEMVGGNDESDETYEVVGTEELAGEEVVKIEQDDAEDGVSHAYIQTGGEHLFLKLEKTGEDEGGALTFSGFGEEIDVEAPAEDEVVNLNELG